MQAEKTVEAAPATIEPILFQAGETAKMLGLEREELIKQIDQGTSPIEPVIRGQIEDKKILLFHKPDIDQARRKLNYQPPTASNSLPGRCT